VEANTITSKVEEEDFATCVDVEMTEFDHKEKNTTLETQNPEENMTNEEKEGLEPSTPRIETSSNDVNNTPRELVMFSMSATKKDNTSDS